MDVSQHAQNFVEVKLHEIKISCIFRSLGRMGKNEKKGTDQEKSNGGY